MNQSIEIPKWWLNLAKYLLIFTICAVFICFSTLWAKNFGGFRNLIVLGLYFIFSFTALLALVVVAAAGILAGIFLKYPLKNYLIVLVLSLTSILYLNPYHSII